MGQFKQKTPEEIQKEKEKEQQEEAAAKAIAIGSRCEVRVGNQPSRRGVVMFVGKEVGWPLDVQLFCTLYVFFMESNSLMVCG